MGRMTGKVVVISGGARGQGRAHAELMSREGADIVVFDSCAPAKSPIHSAATLEDLEHTRSLVEANDRRCIAVQADARDLPGMEALAAQVMADFGRIDTLIVNHGIWAVAENSWTLTEEDWSESIDILLTGAWKVTKAFIPSILAGGRGGSIVLTSSVNGLVANPSSVAYTAAKHGVLGIMKVLAWELGAQGVRVNAVLPGGIQTPMVEGGTVEKSVEYQPRFFGTDRFLITAPKAADGSPQGGSLGNLPGPEVIAEAALYLASEASAWVTGVSLPVDGGYMTY